MYKNIICQNYGCKCQPQVAIEVEKIGRSDDPISEGITVNYVINYARLCHGSKETITQQVNTANRLAVACFNMAVRRLFSSLALLILVVSMNTYRALSFQDFSGTWNLIFGALSCGSFKWIAFARGSGPVTGTRMFVRNQIVTRPTSLTWTYRLTPFIPYEHFVQSCVSA